MLSGEVALLTFSHSTPPKLKYCLCGAPRLFFVISSKPYTFAPADSQLKVFKEELGPLAYDSYLDVSKAYDIPVPDMVQTWPLSTSAIKRIRNAIASQSYLPEVQRTEILNSLPGDSSEVF